jgi:sigma-E factor negative regulatory protein RseB
MKFKSFCFLTVAGFALLAMNYVAAQAPSPVVQFPAETTQGKIAPSGGSAGREAISLGASSNAPALVAESKSVNDWLMRMHDASRKRAYIGTFVVSSGGVMSSAKIWHVCEGNQQMERIETLTGAPRSIFRHNDQVITFMPDQKVVRSEKRESPDMFPEFLQSADSHIADFYKIRSDGVERVAGVKSDIIMLVPKDNMRFGYRVWTEQKKGLVVKLQTLDIDGKVLEQAGFSELQLDAPVKMDKLIRMMGKVEGYHVEKAVLVKTTASVEGWVLKAPVAGFKPISCYRRPPVSTVGDEPLQWVFSDGLASVSIFVESFDPQRHGKESTLSLGATQTITKRLDGYWITIMGEAPITTLRLFASGLEHKK